MQKNGVRVLQCQYETNTYNIGGYSGSFVQNEIHVGLAKDERR